MRPKLAPERGQVALLDELVAHPPRHRLPALVFHIARKTTIATSGPTSTHTREISERDSQVPQEADHREPPTVDRALEVVPLLALRQARHHRPRPNPRLHLPLYQPSPLALPPFALPPRELPLLHIERCVVRRGWRPW